MVEMYSGLSGELLFSEQRDREDYPRWIGGSLAVLEFDDHVSIAATAHGKVCVYEFGKR